MFLRLCSARSTGLRHRPCLTYRSSSLYLYALITSLWLTGPPARVIIPPRRIVVIFEGPRFPGLVSLICISLHDQFFPQSLVFFDGFLKHLDSNPSLFIDSEHVTKVAKVRACFIPFRFLFIVLVDLVVCEAYGAG